VYCQAVVSGFRKARGAYVKVKDSWKYLYRAVDKTGATVDFLLTAKKAIHDCSHGHCDALFSK
jgi:hypothetical protein